MIELGCATRAHGVAPLLHMMQEGPTCIEQSSIFSSVFSQSLFIEPILVVVGFLVLV